MRATSCNGGRSISTLQGVPNDSRHGSKSFSFAGLHFRDLTALQSDGPENLHVEHSQPEYSLGNDGCQSKGFGYI
jgi:hypothetical protein